MSKVVQDVAHLMCENAQLKREIEKLKKEATKPDFARIAREGWGKGVVKGNGWHSVAEAVIAAYEKWKNE